MRFPAEIKTSAAARIVPTLRQEREEWGTHLVWSCPRLKGRATRHKRLVEELLRINRTEGHVRDILIRALADALPRLANSMEKTVVECAEEFSPPVIVVCGQRQRST